MSTRATIEITTGRKVAAHLTRNADGYIDGGLGDELTAIAPMIAALDPDQATAVDQLAEIICENAYGGRTTNFFGDAHFDNGTHRVDRDEAKAWDGCVSYRYRIDIETGKVWVREGWATRWALLEHTATKAA